MAGLNRISNIGKEVWESLFGVVWLLLSLIHVTTGDLVATVSLLNVAGLGILVFDFHPRITKALDKKGDDNFYEEDLGLRLLIVLTTGILSALMLAHIDYSGQTFIERIVSTVVPGFLSIPWLLLAVSPSYLLGLYVYLKDPSTEGPFYRTSEILASSTGEGESHEILEKSIQGELPAKYRYYSIIKSQLGVGLTLYTVAFVMATLVFFTIQAGTLLLLLILGWLAYDLYRLQDPEIDTDLMRRISKGTETPQEWLFEFRLIKGGFKSLIATILCAAGIGGSLAFAGISIGILVGGGESLISDINLIFNRFIENAQAADGVANVILLIVILIIGIFLLLLSTVGVALLPLCTGLYSLMVWYVLMQRLPLWLTDFGTTAVEVGQIDDYPRLPRYVTIVFVYFYIGFVVTARVGQKRDLGELLNLALFILLISFFLLSYVWLLRKGYREIKGDRMIMSPGYDNLRIFYFVSIYLTAGIYLGAFNVLQYVLTVTGMTFIYFWADFSLHTGSKLSRKKANVLEVLYLTVVTVLSAGVLMILTDISIAIIAAVSVSTLAILYFSTALDLRVSDKFLE